MSDLIRRQDAIDAVKTDWNYSNDQIRAINRIPIAQQWIPCSESMPKEHEWIGTKMFGTTISDEVCITFDENGKRFVKVMSLQNGKLSDSDKKTMDAFHEGWKMLAWMPLPEPYKEEK